MSSGAWRQSLDVARWEFRRFVKPKQLLASLVLTVVAGAVGYGLARLAARSAHAEATIAVIGGEALGLSAATSGDGITFFPVPPSARDSVRGAVGARTVDGLLVVRSSDAVELTVAREPVWRDQLEQRLAAARRQIKLREAGLPPARLVEILSPVRLDLRFHEAARGRGARWVALLAGGAVFYGVFTAAAYIFVSITGEKQLRVTEQVLSIVSPQTWIDGKIIGIAGVTVMSLLTMALGVVLFFAGRAAAGARWSPPSAATDPPTLILILVFSVLGFAFWLAFLGAVAATVDDPNTSTRAPIIFLPALFSATAFMIVRSPDSAFARTVGVLPVTSPAVMAARLALTEVSGWEIALAILALLAATWLMRAAAGRIFAVGMLLYGKEASWREVARWLRKS